MDWLKNKSIHVLRSSERYTKTDMVYIFKNGFWMNSNFAVVSIFSFISSILFANLISPKEYGLYQFALAIMNIIGMFVLTGMNAAVTRSVSKGHEGSFIGSIIFQLKFGIVPFLIAIGISSWYLTHSQSQLGLLIMLMAIFVPLNNVFNTWSAFIQAKKDFKTWFIFSAINTILAYSAIFLTLYITRSFVWVIFISMTSSFLINIILFLITLKIYKPNNIKDEENVNSYGLHLSLVSIPTLLSNQLDSILIFHLIGPVQLAIYSLATLIPEKLAGGLKFISTIALPKFAERKEDELKNTITQKTLIILVALIVCMVIYIILIPIFFPIFFPRYLESIPYTQIYSLTIVSVAVGFVQAAMMAHKRTKELYTTSITGAIIKSALMIALIFPFGIWGVLWAQILNQVIILGISLTLFKRESRSIN